MLSKEAATNFAKTKLAPTIVKGTVPADGFGSTALVSQNDLLSAAGTDVFTWKFVDLYGMNTDQLVVWNSFLAGKTDVAGADQGTAGDHRQGRERRLDQEDQGHVIDSAAVTDARDRSRVARRRAAS